jgi:hypothetical protein
MEKCDEADWDYIKEKTMGKNRVISHGFLLTHGFSH